MQSRVKGVISKIKYDLWVTKYNVVLGYKYIFVDGKDRISVENTSNSTPYIRAIDGPQLAWERHNITPLSAR